MAGFPTKTGHDELLNACSPNPMASQRLSCGSVRGRCDIGKSWDVSVIQGVSLSGRCSDSREHPGVCASRPVRLATAMNPPPVRRRLNACPVSTTERRRRRPLATPVRWRPAPAWLGRSDDDRINAAILTRSPGRQPHRDVAGPSPRHRALLSGTERYLVSVHKGRYRPYNPELDRRHFLCPRCGFTIRRQSTPQQWRTLSMPETYPRTGGLVKRKFYLVLSALLLGLAAPLAVAQPAHATAGHDNFLGNRGHAWTNTDHTRLGVDDQRSDRVRIYVEAFTNTRAYLLDYDRNDSADGHTVYIAPPGMRWAQLRVCGWHLDEQRWIGCSDRWTFTEDA
jgi:hypothetical protein